jgi:hypothetical protein
MLLLNDCYRKNQVAWADVVYNIKSLYNLAKAGVYTVKVLSVATVVADEELRAACIFASVCHR